MNIYDFKIKYINNEFVSMQSYKDKVLLKDEEQLYKFLKSQKARMINPNIKWNFTKFLVDRNDNVLKRYPPTTKPENIEKDIEKLFL